VRDRLWIFGGEASNQDAEWALPGVSRMTAAVASPGYMISLLRLISVVGLVGVATIVGWTYQVQHPVYDPTGDVANLQESVAKVMEMRDEKISALISDKTTFSIVGCAHCRGGRESGRSATFEWSIDNPHQIRCAHCGQVYPSPDYPMEKVVEIVNPIGEEQQYHYYEAEDGRTYFWDAKIRDFIKGYFAGRAYDLALLYHLTKEPAYAHKSAVILRRFAEVFPGYCIHGYCPGFSELPEFGSTKPGSDKCGSTLYDIKVYLEHYSGPPYWAGKWSRWFYGNIPMGLFQAHDLICDNGAYEELGGAAKQLIENDLLRASVESIQLWPKRWGNMDGHRIMGFVVAGRVLGEADYVHFAVNWFKELLQKSYFYDGMWHEGTASYHKQITNRLAMVPDLANGHSDPVGYTYAETGERYDDLQMQRDIPALDRAINSVFKLALPVQPNGRSFFAATHDSSWSKVAWGFSRTRSESLLLPGMGHAVLGMGDNESQVQVHLHYSGSYGHDHLDMLNIILHSKGVELLSDLGYHRTSLRGWSSCTQSHNTVTIDEQNQNGKLAGNLLLFAPKGPDVFAAEADGTSRYVGVADVYQRTIVLVKAPGDEAYVVDVFRTTGGSVHDWMQHGYANENQRFETSVSLSPTDGTLYTHIKNLRHGSTDGQWDMIFHCENGVALKTHMLGAEGTQLIVGEVPSLRLTGSDETRIYDYWMPIVAVRRGAPAPEGADRAQPLSSTFVAVHEPYAESTFIDSVEQLPVAGPVDAVAVAVKMGSITDYIISTNQQAPYERETLVPSLNLSFRGRLALVRRQDGKVKWAYIFDGAELAMEDLYVKTAGPLTGQITAVQRQEAGAENNAFVTDSQLPEETDLSGEILIITHGDGTAHGYTIDRAERAGQTTLIHVLDEPGLEITEDETKMVYFPHRTIKGRNTFRIAGSTLLRCDEQGQRTLRSTTQVEKVIGAM